MMQCHFAMLSPKYDIYCAVNCINTPHISLNSQRKSLSYNINHIIMSKNIIELEGQIFEKRLFDFLNKDISLNNIFRNMRF